MSPFTPSIPFQLEIITLIDLLRHSTTFCVPMRAGAVVFEDFFRIMKKKSDNPLDDLDDDDE